MTKVLVKSHTGQAAAGIGLGLSGLLFLALAPASGLLTLPFAVLLLGLAWWMSTGAIDPPPTALRWVLGVAMGVVASMLIMAIGLVIVNLF